MCKHCFNSDRYISPLYGAGRELNTAECFSAIDKIANSKVPHIHLLGGEPLLKKDLFQIIAHAKSRNICVTINTNGIVLSESYSKKLIELGVDQIVVSLDGSKPSVNDGIRGKGTFSKIVANITKLKELLEKSNKSNMKIGVAFTLVKDNLNDVADMLKLAKRLKIDIIDFMDIYISGRAHELENELRFSPEERCRAFEQLALEMRKENYHQLVVQLDAPFSLVDYLNWRYSLALHFHPRNMWCQAGERIWYMQADGRLLPCGMTNNLLYCKAILQKKEYKLETINIKEVSSLEEVDNSDFFKSFRNFKLRVKHRKDRLTCRDCKVNEICLPCPIIHYSLDDIPDCAHILAHKSDFIQDILRKRVHLRSNAKWLESSGEIKIWNELFQTYQIIEGSGKIIWHKIVESTIKVEQIVEEVLSYYHNPPGRNIITEDVVGFIYDLYLSNVIELE
jgi:radical SAM protein with 4Fe4S-binding SPASM domain